MISRSTIKSYEHTLNEGYSAKYWLKSLYAVWPTEGRATDTAQNRHPLAYRDFLIGNQYSHRLHQSELEHTMYTEYTGELKLRSVPLISGNYNLTDIFHFVRYDNESTHFRLL